MSRGRSGSRDAGAGGAGTGDAALRHCGIDTGRPAAVTEPGSQARPHGLVADVGPAGDGSLDAGACVLRAS
ncbi:hypothetical protein PV350_23240 [Streptomyces sp. PA03-6a]|nr:hypothetical protein [Streptomyces sp. PA03-6a]